MRLVPVLLLVLANALWGSSYVVAKVALEEIPPPVLAGLRFGLAAVALWLIVGARKGTRLPPRRDTLRLLALGVVGIGMNGLLGYWGVSLTTATDASLLIVGEVLFTTLFAVALASERLSSLRALGLLVGVIGVLVLIGGGAAAQPTAEAPARALGDVLILAGLAFESIHTVIGTRLAQRYDPLTVLTLSISGSCIVWLPILAGYGLQHPPMPSPSAISGVLYLAGVTSVLCYLIWFAVLRRAGAALGALSLLAQPVVGALLGITLLGDPLTLSTLLGAACVLGCLVLASLPASSPEPQMAVET